MITESTFTILSIEKGNSTLGCRISELTDIGVSSISKIESGHFHPTDENLERIAKALNVEPYKLYMFNHQKDTKELLQDIQTKLNKATDEEIKLAYKVLNGILD